MNVVADTNVMVSALLWPGIPHRLLTAAEAGRLTLYASLALVDELLRVLTRPKFAARLRARRTSPEELIHGYLQLAHLIVPPPIPPVVKDDPSDDAVLACAIAARAAYLITGDLHLLRLASYRGVQIVTPRAFFLATR
jgi:putative PIN family toxin of toxin-antitoxin system